MPKIQHFWAIICKIKDYFTTWHHKFMPQNQEKQLFLAYFGTKMAILEQIQGKKWDFGLFFHGGHTEIFINISSKQSYFDVISSYFDVF